MAAQLSHDGLDVLGALADQMPHGLSVSAGLASDRLGGLALEAAELTLHEFGLLDDVVVVMWGEFGRTPHLSNNAGSDHLSHVM